jgi:hypothetical protein
MNMNRINNENNIKIKTDIDNITNMDTNMDTDMDTISNTDMDPGHGHGRRNFVKACTTS